MNVTEQFSDNHDRNSIYISAIELARSSSNSATTEDLIRFGAFVMLREDLNYDHSWGNARLDAQYLAFFILKLPYEYDQEIYRKTKVSVLQIIDFIKLLENRISRRLPLSYVTNEALYLGRRFYVNEYTLVPRSLMNHKFEEFLHGIRWSNYRVLDLCTGSGCIGITLALLDTRITVDLVDISSGALEVAKVNIDSYFLKDRVHTIQSDLFTNIQCKYDLIITNPPYLPTHEYDYQSAEYKIEPKIALEAGEKGLDIVNRILNDSWKYMNEGGVLIAEIGPTVQDFCRQDYPDMPFEWVVTGKEPWYQGRSGVFMLKYGYQDNWNAIEY